VKLPLLAVAHDRVPRIVAALKAHDGVDLLGEQVGDLALTLVAPLGAHYHDAWHCAVECTGVLTLGRALVELQPLGAKLAPLVLTVQRDQVTADLNEP
jgi:hypothetical protein